MRVLYSVMASAHALERFWNGKRSHCTVGPFWNGNFCSSVVERFGKERSRRFTLRLASVPEWWERSRCCNVNGVTRLSSELYGFYLALYACPVLLVFLKLFSWLYEFCPALYVFLLHNQFLKLFLAFWCSSLSLRSSDKTSGSFSLINFIAVFLLNFVVKPFYCKGIPTTTGA